MPATRYDVLAIGNAVVDVVCRCDESVLRALPGPKGLMTLVPSSNAIREIQAKLKPGIEMAGGGASNMAVGVAYLGGKSAFIGRVADDGYGRIFRHDIRSAGVTFSSIPTAVPGKETARALILVTPDGKRTMLTFLGCSSEINRHMIDASLVDNAKIIFAEGFMMDRADAQAALFNAISMARGSGKRLALSLSDVLCVKRHRPTFQHLVKSGIDILFANEAEALALYDAQSLEEAVQSLRKDAKIAVVTRGEKGSLIIGEGGTIVVAAEKVEKVVDVTGAGELYAAGFLFGLTRAKDLKTCGRIGAFAAAEILRVVGARPQTKLSHLAKLRGFIS